MYNWRKMSDEQRQDLLERRKSQKHPWHSPPHRDGGRKRFHITAACYEHRHIIGKSPERMEVFEKNLTETLAMDNNQVYAWSVLPNHYHCLVRTDNILGLLKRLGNNHGRTSFKWNSEENCQGRKTWHNLLETSIKGEKHFWSTLNYIHNNPIRHRYVKKWDEWPYTSARIYLDGLGKEKAVRIWQKYPITGFGDNWDPPEL